MIRVCKPNGLVGAIDIVLDKVAHYYPDNERYGELYDQYHHALIKGTAKLYGADRRVGYKLPNLFKERGLERVRLDGYAYVSLNSDDRIPFDFKLKGVTKIVKEFDTEAERNRREEDRKILLAGGMLSKEIEEFNKLSFERDQRIVENPKLLNEDASVNGGIFFITTGIKRASK